MGSNRERILEYINEKGSSNINQIKLALNLDWRTVALNIAELKTDGVLIEKERIGISRVIDIKRG